MSEPAAQEAVSDTALGPAHQGVGASVRRNEDRRLLDGGGAYLADLQVPGLAEIAFLRSPLAHGRIRAVEVPPRHRGSVFFAADIAFAKPIIAVGASAGFKYSEYPALASNKVRFVGDLIGICVAPTRAEAEDIAQSCSVDFEELPAIWDIDVALAAGATPIHDDWTDNIFAQTRIETGDLEAVRASAPVTVHKRLRMERHAGVSLECRGVLAHHERRLDELIVYSSTQFPHVIRTMLAQAVGFRNAIAGDRARCRRGFRDQEQLQSGGDRGHRTGAEARKAAALDRGSPRAFDRIAACARAPLRADRPCR
jgi:carbon-monoxide dehydrogenase large subunit